MREARIRGARGRSPATPGAATRPVAGSSSADPMQIHARVDIRSCSGGRKVRDSAGHRAEPGRRCAYVRLSKYLGQNIPKLERAVDIARSGVLSKAGLIPATVLVREIDPSGGRRRRASSAWNFVATLWRPLASAGEDPMAEEVRDTRARLQLTRSGRDCGYAEPSRLFASRPQLRPPPVRAAMSGGVG
jgi:hypothetical protein